MHLSEFIRSHNLIAETDIPEGHGNAVALGDKREAVTRAASLAIYCLLQDRNIEPALKVAAR